MRVLRAVVGAQSLLVRTREANFAKRRPVGSQLVGAGAVHEPEKHAWSALATITRPEASIFAQLPECLVGMEACGSAHHWARELIKLGHDARMMPPAYVKPYVRRQKNDAADAAGICEAVTRALSRRFGLAVPLAVR